MPTATATAQRRTGPRSAPDADGRPTLGVLDSIRTSLATVLKVIRTRLEVISTELEEQREWMQNLVLLAVAGMFFVCMGLVMLTLFIVAMFWESHPMAVLGGFAGLYLAAGVWAALAFRVKMQARPKFLEITTQELARDEAHLRIK